MSMTFPEMLLRLLLALLAGGIVGMEREQRERPAGLRTHMLVCVGSALFTLVSIQLSPDKDQTRIAAQIVTGIGFLGAGTIFRASTGVRGLTTAAGIWVIAAVGMAIASGGWLLVLGLVASVLIFAVNRWGRLLEFHHVRLRKELTLALPRSYAGLGELFAGMQQRQIQIEHLEWLCEAQGENLLCLRLHLPAKIDLAELTAWIAGQPGVDRVQWD